MRFTLRSAAAGTNTIKSARDDRFPGKRMRDAVIHRESLHRFCERQTDLWERHVFDGNLKPLAARGGEEGIFAVVTVVPLIFDERQVPAAWSKKIYDVDAAKQHEIL